MQAQFWKILFPMRNPFGCMGFLFLNFWLASLAHAASFRAVVGGGYTSMQWNASEAVQSGNTKPKPLTGPELSALVEFGFLDSIPGFSLLIGGGPRFSSLTSAENQNGSKLVLPSLLTAVAELGAEFSLIPLLRLQILSNADFLMSGGKFQSKLGSTTVNFPQVKDFAKYGLTARTLFTVAPFLSFGVEPSYFQGSFLLPSPTSVQESARKDSKVEFSQWGVKALVALTF